MSSFLFQTYLIVLFAFWCTEQTELKWNDDSLDDGPCVFPKPIKLPQWISQIVLGSAYGKEFYLSMANAAYFRWQYEITTKKPATSEDELDTLKPRVVFTDVPILFGALAPIKVNLFESKGDRYYSVQCLPTNFAITNVSCRVTSTRNGPHEPIDFTGTKRFASTLVWADKVAWAEWRCFEGNRQMYNVISTHPNLTQAQIDANIALAESYGFNVTTFQFQTYDGDDDIKDTLTNNSSSYEDDLD